MADEPLFPALDDTNRLLADLAEARRLRQAVLDARAAFQAAQSELAGVYAAAAPPAGVYSRYDAALATLCKANARFNRHRGALAARLGLDGV